ncbi:CHAT domain protein [Ceratobasidium sp. AG-Ba]|nr:CHAT domain protein [Ceratobasidium sp. AG-Ba]
MSDSEGRVVLRSIDSITLANKDENGTRAIVEPLSGQSVESMDGNKDVCKITSRNPASHMNMLLAALDQSIKKYHSQNDLGSLHKSIDYARQVVELSARRRLPTAWPLMGLGSLLRDRFKIYGRMQDIDEAIQCGSRAVMLRPEGQLFHGTCLSWLGTSWMLRFDRLRGPDNLSNAIKFLDQGINLTDDSDPQRRDRLNNHGIARFYRFELLGNLEDLEHAVKCQTQTVILTPDNDSERPGYLSELGKSLQTRFERLREIIDIYHSIICNIRAVVLTPGDHPDKPRHLSNLGSSWLCRFNWLGERMDVSHAIDCMVQAITLTPDNHPLKPNYLSSFGKIWRCRFERFGELVDLDHAIDCHAQAVTLTPDSHLNKPDLLGNLGDSRLRRFECLGELEDIDCAIRYNTQAQPQQAGLSEQPGKLLEPSIRASGGTLSLAPDGSRDKSHCLNNLGISLVRRFDRRKEPVDIDHAIGCETESVTLTPEGDPKKAGRLNNLGSWCALRFESTGKLSDLDHAIGHQARAVALTPDKHPSKPGRLTSLGNSWRRRFDCLGELGDLDRAIDFHANAVSLTSDGHPEKPERLFNLGSSLRCRFGSLGQIGDLEHSCNASRVMQCAHRWATISIMLKVSPLQAYQRVFSLLPRLVWIGQTIQNRHQTITSISDLARQAVAWAISTQCYDLALEWLEQGRSVVWGQTLQLRTPLDTLALAHPELAQQMQDVALQLDAAGSDPDMEPQTGLSPVDLVSQANHHHQLAYRWDQLLEQARSLPGFENLLRPLSSNQLKQAARDGPIVVINSADTGCDALIIVPGEKDMIHVPLTQVASKQLEELTAQLDYFIGRSSSSNESRGVTDHISRDQTQPLALMWSGPVLRALGYTNEVLQEKLPHVTWCATGALSFLPFHAAGLYDGISPNTSELIVSSYIPTLTALVSFERPLHAQSGLLVVGQEASPGQIPLPKTVDELEIIDKYATHIRLRRLERSSATVRATLSGMEEHGWVHLACHAVQNRDNPSHSAFHLHDGVLTLKEISRRQFKNKGLAFLSACQTARGHQYLPDEATHLAAGMLVSGYPSVIATMWSINDDDGPPVAEIVYSELLKEGQMNHEDSARALHKAVKNLRESVGKKAVWRWAPFIHMGV